MRVYICNERSARSDQRLIQKQSHQHAAKIACALIPDMVLKRRADMREMIT